MSGATGHFCEIAASTRTTESSSGSSTKNREPPLEIWPARESPRAKRLARRTWFFHARRMGIARSYLDWLAAQPHRLARQARTDSVGVRRNCPQDFSGRNRAHSGELGHSRKTSQKHFEIGGRDDEPDPILLLPDESWLDAGFWTDICAARETATRIGHRPV